MALVASRNDFCYIISAKIYFLSTPTCYVECLVERDGELVMIPFAKPKGGPEGLAEIGKMLERWVADRALFNTDHCNAYIAFCKDHREKQIFHFICNHSQVDEFGFVW